MYRIYRPSVPYIADITLIPALTFILEKINQQCVYYIETKNCFTLYIVMCKMYRSPHLNNDPHKYVFCNLYIGRIEIRSLPLHTIFTNQKVT